MLRGLNGRMDETLILLPGLLCDRAMWSEQCAALEARGARCHVPEWGLLDSLPAMAEHVLATAPAERFALAGFSMGGRVAFEVWRRAPERVARLALLDTSYHPRAPGPAGDAERAQRMRLLDIARRDGMRALGLAWLPGMVHRQRVGTPLWDELLAMVERHSPEQYAAQVEALLARPDAEPLLATIDCPTLLLCGRDDAWSPPARHEFMAARIVGARLVVVDDCGHFAPAERPDAVTSALAVWMQSSGRT